jgi:hypothetical protein
VDGNGDFRSDLLTAKERDLSPLFEESAETLDLDSRQAVQMEAFLDEAWFGGSYTGHAQVLGWAEKQGTEVPPPDMAAVEAEFKGLMEASAEALDLNVVATIHAWGILGRAWVAGVHSCRNELMALLVTSRTDVAAEVQRWLEEKGGQDEDGDQT